MNKGTLGYPGRWWASPEIAMTVVEPGGTNKGAVDIVHGMGELPFLVELVLVNKLTELGYPQGGEVSFSNFTGRNVQVTRTRSALRVSMFDLPALASDIAGSFASTAITLANWNLKVYALFP